MKTLAVTEAIYVYRNGNPIGRASVEVSGRGALGDHVFTLLEGTTARRSFLAPGRGGKRWMSVASSGRRVIAADHRVASPCESGICQESV